MMLTWAGYKFKIDTAPFTSVSHSYDYPWASQPRTDNFPMLQTTGKETHKLTLKGVIFTHFKSGYGQIDTLRGLAKKREPRLLVTGWGVVLGMYVLKSIQSEDSHFISIGVPKKQSFTLVFERLGE